MKLLIIGNGFDIKNGLSTKLSDFKNFLEIHYPSDLHYIEETFGISDDEWNKMESKMGRSLSHIEGKFMEIIENNISTFEEEHYDEEWRRDDDTHSAIEDNAYQEFISPDRLNLLLRMWIESIDTSNVTCETNTDNLVIINFNYTNYIEIENDRVIHPHSVVGDDWLKFGHSVVAEDLGYVSDYGSRRINHNSIFDGHNKQIDSTVAEVREFVVNFEIEEIEFIGFSLGTEDVKYIDVLPKNCTCVFNWYTQSDLQRAETILRPKYPNMITRQI